MLSVHGYGEIARDALESDVVKGENEVAPVHATANLNGVRRAALPESSAEEGREFGVADKAANLVGCKSPRRQLLGSDG